MWITDPKTKKPSVSLTLMMIATALMIVFIVVEAFTHIQSSSLLDEFFFATYSLYFGRRVQAFASVLRKPKS